MAETPEGSALVPVVDTTNGNPRSPSPAGGRTDTPDQQVPDIDKRSPSPLPAGGEPGEDDPQEEEFAVPEAQGEAGVVADGVENAEEEEEEGAGGGGDGEEEPPVCPLTPEQVTRGLRILRWRYRSYPDKEMVVQRLINCSVRPPPPLHSSLLQRMERGQPTFDFYAGQADEGTADADTLHVCEEELELLHSARRWLYRLLCVYHHLNPDNPMEPAADH